ncbi:MAG: 2-oxoacid:ferredoxin oxidoreductase subunit beta [Desulfobacterales bacterium]|nr:MAG: 2-oxoacid:ferredoxin oxidoreductase subunit beta [Desulfobacterales bacterium]
MVTLQEFASDDPIAWCPGCGNFSILKALKQALVELQKKPHEIAIVSGIGQAPKTPHYLRCNTFNGLHGRTLPVAAGLKLANHELTVLAEGGDGDGYGEGGNHFIHAMRRNIDITYLVHNNQVYGLTKGQTSPTSESGFITKTTPSGSPVPPMNPLLLAVACDCSFVARGFAGAIEHLTDLIRQGIRHRGFALIDILQPCVSFNRVNTFQWYEERVYPVGEGEYDPGDRTAAFNRAQEWGERIPIGIIYRRERPTLSAQHAAIARQSLVRQPIDPTGFPGLLEAFQ